MPHTHLPHNHGEKSEAVFNHLPSTEDFMTVSELFRQLGDASRIKIFWILCHCEECVINISAMMNMSSPAVSHHLKQLKASGLIVSCRKGKEVYYKASDSKQSVMLHEAIETLVMITCPSVNK